jgi:phospholipase/carboxylesterase
MEPHGGQPVLTLGPGVESSRAAMIMMHGRNAGPRNILDLAGVLHHPDFTYLAPAAAGGTWYPFSFLAETARNEPGLSSGLWVIDRLVQDLEAKGIPGRRIILLGFSQGACLSSEYAVRHAGRLGGLVAYSGGLIGPLGTVWDYPGSFDGMPVFLGCSDVDAHVPKARVDESAAVFTRMGAAVTERIYPGMGHQVNEDELELTRTLMDAVSRKP